MCKFRGPNDEGYREVRFVIGRYLKGLERLLDAESMGQ
jgi:hypothetical protein